MGAVGTGPAGNTAVGTGAILARESGDAVVGIIATGFDTEATVDRQLAIVGRISAVSVVCASATAYGETTRQVFATRGKTNLTGRTRVLGITEDVEIRTAGTERAPPAPGAASATHATNAATTYAANATDSKPSGAFEVSSSCPITAASISAAVRWILSSDCISVFLSPLYSWM